MEKQYNVSLVGDVRNSAHGKDGQKVTQLLRPTAELLQLKFSETSVELGLMGQRQFYQESYKLYECRIERGEKIWFTGICFSLSLNFQANTQVKVQAVEMGH